MCRHTHTHTYAHTFFLLTAVTDNQESGDLASVLDKKWYEAKPCDYCESETVLSVEGGDYHRDIT